MLCSLACHNVATESISETVQLAPVNHTGATLAFSWCGRPEICRGEQAGWAGRVRRIDSARIGTPYVAQYSGRPRADKSHQVHEQPSLKERNEASACRNLAANFWRALASKVSLERVCWDAAGCLT